MRKIKCEVCGKMVPQNEMSKSYRHRCKKCVAEMTRAQRHARNKSREKPFFNGSATPIKNHPTAFAIAAPTLCQAQKWLRAVKGLHIAITWGYSFQWLWFGLHITKFPKGDEFEKGNFGYSTYEQALFAGISASLQLIEKGE